MNGALIEACARSRDSRKRSLQMRSGPMSEAAGFEGHVDQWSSSTDA